MLKWLRKNRNVKVLVLGGLAALMALWGLGSVLGSRSASDAGMLFGRKISWRTFSDQQQLIAQSAPILLGERGLSPETLPTHTWLRLMLLEEAHRRLLTVTDEDVIATIERLPLFTVDGRFDQARYQRILQWHRLPPRRFEEEIRQRLLIDRLRAQVLADVPLDEAAARQAYDRDHAQGNKKPNDAGWRKDREAFLPQWRASVQQQRWQAYLTDVLQRAQLTSYLR